MLRALTVAALLLFSLLWTVTGMAATRDTLVALRSAAEIAHDLHLATSTTLTSAAVITVTTTADEANSDGDCSLREAIEAAATDNSIDSCPAGEGGDTVYLPPGQYLLTSGPITLTGLITLQGSITAMSSMDAGLTDRVLYIQSDAVVMLLDLDISNGRLPRPECFSCEEAERNGAGVANYGMTLIAHSTIHNNRTDYFNSGDPFSSFAASGGGIYNDGVLTVTNSTIHDNESGGGGGIYNDGILLVSNSTIRDNVSGRSAGGIYNNHAVIVTNSTISGNASGGGGCSLSHGGMYSCGSGWDGGGIYNAGSLGPANSTISGNATGASGCAPGNSAFLCGDGGDGGGIYNSGSVTITNSTVSGNMTGAGGCGCDNGQFCVPSGEGGAIANEGSLTLDNATLANNATGEGGVPFSDLEFHQCFEPGGNPVVPPYGLVGGVYSKSGEVTVKNSIISDNARREFGGHFTLFGDSLIDETTGCTVSGSFVQWPAHLDNLRDNGGPTLTHALEKNSPAIDAGTCIDSVGMTVTVDQRGEPRPQGEGCDIGAFESPYTSTFKIRDTSLPLIWH